MQKNIKKRRQLKLSQKSSSKKSYQKKKPLKTWLFLGCIVALTGVIILTLKVISTKDLKTEEQTKTSKVYDSKEVIELDLAMVGDMLPHETVTNSAKTNSGYEYLKLISPELQTAFKKADFRFCNQEAVSAPSLGVRGYPAFNAPKEFPEDLRSFGCNLTSLANNHIADQGVKGIDETNSQWKGHNGILASGANSSTEEQRELRVLEVDGIRVGFVAFTDHSNNSISPSYKVNQVQEEDLLKQQIEGLQKSSDIVLVSVHWGSEDSHKPNSKQEQTASKIANYGADIIVGTGPHVWQPYTQITKEDGHKTHVWYSIGNGLNSQTKADQLFSGIALMRLAKKGQEVTVSDPRVLPTYMHYVWVNGVGLSDPQLLGRKDLSWGLLAKSEGLIGQRNDFKTTVQEQKDLLRGYLGNEAVEILETY